MTPVISPWVFYLMPVATKIQVLAVIVMLILILVYIGLVIAYFINYDIDDDVCTAVIKVGKTLIAPLIISIVLFLAIPSEKTVTKMIVAENVTYERVEAVSDTVETVYNDIMELFENDEDS